MIVAPLTFPKIIADCGACRRVQAVHQLPALFCRDEFNASVFKGAADGKEKPDQPLTGTRSTCAISLCRIELV